MGIFFLFEIFFFEDKATVEQRHVAVRKQKEVQTVLVEVDLKRSFFSIQRKNKKRKDE